MTPQAFIDYMQYAFQTSLLLCLPVLGTALVVGILVSMFQSITSIQEQTLVFVPKILAVIGALVVFFNFMLRTIVAFTVNAFHMISQVTQ